MRGRELGSAQDYAFIQLMMQKGFMRVDKALEVMEFLHGKADQGMLAELMATFNKRNRCHSFSLEKMMSLVDKKEYIAFVNKDGDDPASKMGSSYTQPQREFFKFVLESLALSGSSPESGGLLSSFDALCGNNSVLDLTQGNSQGGFRQKMTKRDMEQTLEKLVGNGWLGESKSHPGHYSIGVRSFMELKRYLLNLPLPQETRDEWSKIL